MKSIVKEILDEALNSAHNNDSHVIVLVPNEEYVPKGEVGNYSRSRVWIVYDNVLDDIYRVAGMDAKEVFVVDVPYSEPSVQYLKTRLRRNKGYIAIHLYDIMGGVKLWQE